MPPYFFMDGHCLRMKEKITKGTIIRYSLYQLPELAVLIVALFFFKQWIIVTDIILYGIVTAWIAKDVILFFFTWKAYIPGKKDIMIGKKGITLERIIRTGYIKINGEQWKALNRSDGPLERGQEILVVERKGLTLYVEPSGFKNAE